MLNDDVVLAFFKAYVS